MTRRHTQGKIPSPFLPSSPFLPLNADITKWDVEIAMERCQITIFGGCDVRASTAFTGALERVGVCLVDPTGVFPIDDAVPDTAVDPY